MYNVNPYTNIKQDKNIYNHQARISKELSPSVLPKQKRVRSGWYCWPFCLPGSLSIWDTGAGDNDNNNSFRVIYPVKKRALYNTNYRNNHSNTRAHDVIQYHNTITGRRTVLQYNHRAHDVIQYHNTITGIHKLTTSYSTTIQSQQYTSSPRHTVPQYNHRNTQAHDVIQYHNTITGIHELTTSYSTTIQSQEYTSSRRHTVPQYNHRNTQAHDVIQYHNTITGIHELTTSYSTTIQSQEYTSSRRHTVPQYNHRNTRAHDVIQYHNTNYRNNQYNQQALCTSSHHITIQTAETIITIQVLMMPSNSTIQTTEPINIINKHYVCIQH